jgi:hypothetical protein
MDRRRFLLASLAGVIAAPLGAEAQQAGRLSEWATFPLVVLHRSPKPSASVCQSLAMSKDRT